VFFINPNINNWETLSRRITKNKNRTQIQKLLNKREQIVIDVTVNNKHIANYKRKLDKITFEIEYLYYMGVIK